MNLRVNPADLARLDAHVCRRRFFFFTNPPTHRLTGNLWNLGSTNRNRARDCPMRHARKRHVPKSLSIFYTLNAAKMVSALEAVYFASTIALLPAIGWAFRFRRSLRERVGGMDSATAPLTPADCDLRGYEFMPLYGTHLYGSEFNARATDDAWRAAITLWWAAWNQKPAASLPNDDVALCRLADLGRDLKHWQKIKATALHGFALCADGRLYHRFLAPLAIEAWNRRCRDRDRKASWRQKKDGDATGTGSVTDPAMRRGQDADVTRMSPLRGEERKGEERKGEVGGEVRPPTPRDVLMKELRRRGMSTAPTAIDEWASFLSHSCGLKSPDECALALDLLSEAARRDGVALTYSKTAAPWASGVKDRLRDERKKQKEAPCQPAH